MARHGYRFAEANADPSSQAAYQVLYTQMIDYYTGLYSLQLAVQSDIRDEQDLTQRADKLFQNGYRNTMDDLTAALQARPPLHWSEILKNVGDGVSGIGHGVRDFRKKPRN